MKHFVRFLSVFLCLSLLSACGSEGAGSQKDAQSSAPQTETSTLLSPQDTEDTEESSQVSSPESSIANEISYPLEGEHTFTIAINPNGLISTIMDENGFTTSVAYSAMEDATGVHLDWTLYSEATWNEQFNLLMASNDWPDLFDCGVTSRYATGVSGLLEDDVVVELSGYLEEYAPDYLRLLNENQGFSSSIVQQGGEIVEFATAMSSFQDQGMMIRQDWLDALNLDVPETVDELTEVLKAFKNEYDLSMPLMVQSGLDTGLTYTYNVDRRGFSNAGMGWVVENGTVKCTFDTDGFRDYLALLSDYYAQGLFDDNFVNISNELNTIDSTYLDGKCGVFFTGVAALAESQKANAADPNFQLTALADIKVNADDPNSGVSEISYTGINSISISTQCSDPEAAMMFCNYFYTEEGQMLANWGIEGETYTLVDGQPQYTDLVKNDTECFMYMMTMTRYALQWAPTVFDSNVSSASYDQGQKAAMEMWTEGREAYLLIPKNATSNEDEQEIENLYGSDVATYLWENIFKIVTNQQSVDSYDQVIETANGMGLTELTASKQSCYDRYMASHPA